MRMTRTAATILSAVLGATMLAEAATAQVSGPEADSTFAAGNFIFTRGARTALIALWKESTEANAERVACIGGYRQNGIARITTVREIPSQAADSMQVQAVESIEQCRPPQWFGTVHTHIVRYKNELPYSTFSAADRGVIAQWHRTWQTDGTFCVLFNDVHAHCETGYERSGDAAYAKRYGGGPAAP